MNPAEILVALDRISGHFETLLQQTPDWGTRAPALVRLLREAWPGAALYACLICPGDTEVLAVLDAEGNPAESWRQRLQEQDQDRVGVWTRLLESSGNPVVIQPVNGASRGLLALSLRPENACDLLLARHFLSCFARTLGRQVALTHWSHEATALRESVSALEPLASIGELAGPLAHEFTNFLNVLLLQVTILEYQLPQNQRTDLAEIRRQGELATETVARFHRFRREHAPEPRDIDLNRIVLDVAREWSQKLPVGIPPFSLAPATNGSAVQLQVIPSSGLAVVRGTGADLRRLIQFLLSNALRIAAAGVGQVIVRIETEAGRSRLLLEASGAPLSPEELTHLFDTSYPKRDGVEPLELAACRSLVRRLGGRIRAESRSGPGVRIRVEFGEESP